MRRQDLECILADPFAPEKKWMAACVAGQLSTKEPSHNSFNAVLLSVALAVCTSSFAMFAFDWGREVLEEIILRDCQFTFEMVMAAALNLCVILPASFGLYSGYLLKNNKNSLLQILSVTAIGLALLVSLFSTFPWYAVGLSVAGIAAALGMRSIGRTVQHLSDGKPLVRKTFLPALIYLLPAGFLLFFHLDDGNFGFKEELGIFLSLVFFACTTAAINCRAKNNAAALSSGIFATLPLLLVNLTNLAGVLAVGVLDPSRAPEALFSALIVMSTTTAAGVSGSLLGLATAKHFLSRASRNHASLETRYEHSS